MRVKVEALEGAYTLGLLLRKKWFALWGSLVHGHWYEVIIENWFNWCSFSFHWSLDTCCLRFNYRLLVAHDKISLAEISLRSVSASVVALFCLPTLD